MSVLGWFANALIVVGLWKMGSKWRHAFLFTFVGELLWTAKAMSCQQWDLAAICVVFSVLAIRNWKLWK
jgi:hypothetical protein